MKPDAVFSSALDESVKHVERDLAEARAMLRLAESVDVRSAAEPCTRLDRAISEDPDHGVVTQ